MNVTPLNARAMLVKLTVRRANLTRRDAVAEEIIQRTLDDASLIVNSKLFRDKMNPINKILSACSEVYTYHRTHTLPWADKGPRILPNDQYLEYTTAMRERIQNVTSLLREHMPKFDTYVQLDIQYRSMMKNATSRASVDDYPSAEEFESRMGLDIRFMPLPDSSHFLFDISEEDKAGFEQSLAEAAASARNDVVQRMLKPLSHLVEKLNKPIGTEGSVFRDSAVENVIEGLDLARKLAINPAPELVASMDELSQSIRGYAMASSQLRESPVVREQAAKKLASIAQQMGAWMGG